VKLIVGLGNPGPEYRDTRHNVGFRVVDEIARRHQLTWAMAPAQVPDAFVVKKFGSPLGAGRSADADRLASAASRVAERPDVAKAALLLAKPLTFMNLSGDAVAALARYYDIAAADLLVVVDDVDLPFGRLRARQRGSAGTHNGLRSIVNRLGTTEFPRLRVGVGRGDERRDLADHVLSKFERDEVATLDTVIARAADAAEMFAATDILEVMNTYNADDAASAATD
jgi:PTH1 family peptidyl-tRNA hydrolase